MTFFREEGVTLATFSSSPRLSLSPWQRKFAKPVSYQVPGQPPPVHSVSRLHQLQRDVAENALCALTTHLRR